MSRVLGAAAARVRLALAIILGGAGAFLMPSLLATAHTPSAAVLAAVTVATVVAVVRLNRPVTRAVSRPPALPARHTDHASSFLAERVTDAARHPQRPRAPGLV